MDPMKCLVDLDQAISDNNFPLAVQLLDSYYQWRLRGGLEPNRIDIAKITQNYYHGDSYASYCAFRLVDNINYES